MPNNNNPNNNNNNNPNNNNILNNNSNNTYLNGILNELKNEHETNVLTLYTKSLNETLAKLPPIVQGEDNCIPNSPIEYNSDVSSESESPIDNDEDTEMVDGESEIIKKETNEEGNIIKTEVTEETDTTSSIQENEKKIDKMDVEENSSIGKENVDINTTNSNNNNTNNTTAMANKSIANGESEDNSNNSTSVPQKRPQNPLTDRYHNPKKTRKIIIPYETSVPFEESRIFSIGRSIESFCTPKPIINSKGTEIKSRSNDSHKKNNTKDTKDNKIKVSLSNKITLKLSSHTPYHPPPVPSVNISDLFHDIYSELSINDKKNNDDDSYFQQPSLLTENSMESNLVKKETTIEHIKSMKIDPPKENNNTNNDTNDPSLNTNGDINNNSVMTGNANSLEGTIDESKPGINLSELLSLTSNKIFNTMLKNEFTAEDSLFGCRRGGDIRIVDELSESVVPAIQQQSEESIENRDKKKDDPNDKNGANGTPSGTGPIGGVGKEDISSLAKLNSGNAANKIFLHNNHVNIHVHNGGASSVSNTAHIATYNDDNEGHGHGRSRSPAHNRNNGITGYMNSAPSTYHATSVTSSPTGHSKHSGHTITFKNPNSKKDQDASDSKEEKTKNSINITLHKKKSTVTREDDEAPEESERVHKKNSSLSAEVVTPTHIKLFKRHSTSATYVNEEDDANPTTEDVEPSPQPRLEEHDTMEVFEEVEETKQNHKVNDDEDDDDIEGDKKLKERSKLPIKLINKLKLGFGKKSDTPTVPSKISKYDDDEEKTSTDKPVKKPNTITLKEYKKNNMSREKKEEINGGDDDDNENKNGNGNLKKEVEEEENYTAQYSEDGKELTEEPESMLENEFEEFVEEDEEEFMKSFEKELDEKVMPEGERAHQDKKKEMDRLFGEEDSSEEEFNEEDMTMEISKEEPNEKKNDTHVEDKIHTKANQLSSPEEEIEEFNDEFNEIEEEEEEEEEEEINKDKGSPLQFTTKKTEKDEPSPPDKIEFEEFNDEFEEFNDDDDDDDEEEIDFDAMK
ncbi:hypothetical protein PIROE2DRAFT_60562 [Piromyces sp. E2]|nr:hypothetical protein PIROE2DRAFT_60562 [Piromyces sp. E2]|eukprot:OUM64603.1 hypothetical protein PIROE2DRAFT_60562 [Piromyces sp. E2]